MNKRSAISERQGLTLLGWLSCPERLDPERARREYEAGNQVALALAIHSYGQTGVPLPPWVVKAFAQGCYDVCDRKIESWDEVLANSKRKSLKQLLRERIKGQKKALILLHLHGYSKIAIRRTGDPKNAPDRFDTIAADLTAYGARDGARTRLWPRCTPREARALYYELLPQGRRPQRLPKRKRG